MRLSTLRNKLLELIHEASREGIADGEVIDRMYDAVGALNEVEDRLLDTSF